MERDMKNWKIALVFCIMVITCCLFSDVYERDFCGSSVLVVLDNKLGGINKVHEISFFGIDDIIEIVDLFRLEGDALIRANPETFRQILGFRLSSDDKANVLRVVEELKKIEGVLKAGPNYIEDFDRIPNDPRYSDQWGLHRIQASHAWNYSIGSRTIKVGIIDSGITNHSDLVDNLTTGWNFVQDYSNTTSVGDWHGTHVAGIVGAVGNNGNRVVGVNWEVTLVPLKVDHWCVINERYRVERWRVVEAIEYATRNNIPILNHSISGFGLDCNDKRIDAIRNYPGLFVWSVGNRSRNHDAYTSTAAFDLPNLISVGSTMMIGNLEHRWTSSSYGPNSVSIWAPGGSILSTITVFGFSELAYTRSTSVQCLSI
jgi:hypothetical protein